MSFKDMLSQRLPLLGLGNIRDEMPRLSLLMFIFGSTASIIYLLAGLGQWSPSFDPIGQSLALAAGFFFLPSLAEELLWRWLLIPPSHAGKADATAFKSIGLTTSVFTMAHPLAAWLFVPHARPMFWNPWFLVIVLLLGLTCGTAYVLARSIWPPVVIHWLTVLAWKFLLGGPFIMLGR